MQLNKSSK